MLRFALPLFAALVVGLSGSPATGQQRDTTRAGGWLRSHPLLTVGSDAEDRLRTLQLLGRAPLDGFLLRSPSLLSPALLPTSGGPVWAPILPELRASWNSAIPASMNEGAMWAGRGAAFRLMGGVRAAWGPVSLTLAPELVYAQNRAFESLLPLDLQRELNPSWQRDRFSADLPLRPGYDPVTALDPGQSALVVNAGPVAVGAATESQWWGPGLRNAIVLSNNAPGVPHLFLRTSAPARTPLGQVEARWIAGALAGSGHFGVERPGARRSLSAVAATLRPAFEPRLTLGLARAVYASVDGAAGVPGRALDVLTRWSSGQRSLDRDGADPEQIFSLFGRLVQPEDGVEVYAEWARHELPGSLQSLLTEPNHSQGYTVGLQWARPLRGSALFRLQSEATNLEQSPTSRWRPTDSFYASRSVPYGYTHRGRVLGAAIGPGASGQWLAMDYVEERWRLGLFGGRTRWNNDAYYEARPVTALYRGHDVSVFGGVRGSYPVIGLQIDLELGTEKRYNYLFQNSGYDWATSTRAVDVRNHSLRLTLAPVRRSVTRVVVPVTPVTAASAGAVDGAPEPLAETDPDRDTEAPVPDGPGATHEVAPGEKLPGIAERYGVSVEALRTANGLRDDRLLPGQILVIPAGSR